MSLGSTLIGGLLNSAFEPSLNEGLHVDANGNFTDAQGNPTTPYKSPSFLARSLSPASQQAYMANQAAQLQGPEMLKTALNQNSANLGVGRSNWNLQPDSVKAAIPQDSFATEFGSGTVDPSKLEQSGVAVGDINGGIIPTTVKSNIGQAGLNLSNVNAAIARQPIEAAAQSQNAINALSKSLNVDPLNLELTRQQLRASLQREPNVEELTNATIANQQTKATQEAKILPITGETDYNNALVGQGLSRQQKTDLPMLRNTLANSDVMHNYESQFENPGSILSPKVSGNTVSLGRTLTPTQMQVMQASLGGTGGKAVTGPSGTKWQAPPMYTAPTGTNDTASPSAQAVQRGVGPTREGSVDLPPATTIGAAALPANNTGTPPPTAGGSSAKTDDYESLIHEAVKAAITYTRNSPQYAQALAKIHSKEAEEAPDVLGEDNNASLPFALGSVAADTSHGIGRAYRSGGKLAAKGASKLVSGVAGIARPFWQGLTTDDQ